MSLPLVYGDPTEFGQFLLGILGPQVVAVLTTDDRDWGDPATYEEIINDTLLAYGVEELVLATDAAKLRAIGRLHLWQAVADATVWMHSQSMDGQSYQLQQVHEHAVRMAERARREVNRIVPTYRVEVGRVRYRDIYAVAARTTGTEF
jgi:hypothetical protein